MTIEDGHKRGSEREREFSPGQIEEARIMVESADKVLHKPKKLLKPARSQAELTRVRQGYLLISLNCLNVLIAGLIALKSFGII